MSDFDLILYGATGYTGRLVAEYLHGTYGRDLNWAIAARSADKLAQVGDDLGLAHVPAIAVDGADRAGLDAMVARTRIVVSLAGPYALYGSDLVAAVAAAGRGYCDLTGEPWWMRDMIDAHGAAAEASGARILFSCGFDSIPSDLGLWTLQEAAIARTGKPAPHVEARVAIKGGGYSGGTVASLRAGAGVSPKILFDPFLLTPGFRGPAQPDDHSPREDAGEWAAPFVMAAINSKNVHRTNLLTGHRYGTDFTYREMMAAGSGEKGHEVAGMVAAAGVKLIPPLQPGDGPTREEREAGRYAVTLTGTLADGGTLRARVTGDRDPGYGSTSKMISETALTLLATPDARPGISTPAALLGARLRDRLVARAGMTFDVLD